MPFTLTVTETKTGQIVPYDKKEFTGRTRFDTIEQYVMYLANEAPDHDPNAMQTLLEYHDSIVLGGPVMFWTIRIKEK